MALNKEQQDAVDTLDGPVMVVAGPGTGKTTVLTMRIANILQQGKKKNLHPEQILALTFTEAGAIEMRRKLSELIGQDAYRVEISTFHGFANRVIRDYPDYFPAIIGAANITEIDQVSIMRKLIDALPLKDLRPFGDRYFYLRNILAAINELKRQGVTPEAFAEMTAIEKKDFYANPDLMNASGKYEGKMKTKYANEAKHVERNLELVSLYTEYQKALVAARQYDYSDMIMYVVQALESNEEMLRVLQDAYEYVLVDEHQDTNDAQNRMIELLASGRERPNLFVVGDEKQAIYRFQGASDENFRYFSRKYKNVKSVSLKDSYRSTQAILDVAQEISPRDEKILAKNGSGNESEKDGKNTNGKLATFEPSAHLAVLSAPDVEYFFIAEKIKELLKTKYRVTGERIKPEEIAVLYRDNKDAAPLARMLEKEKVAFNIESDQDVLGDDEIKKLVRILRAVQFFGNDILLAEALHVDFLNIPPIDVYKLTSFAAKQRKKIYDVLRSEALLDQAGIESKQECLKFFAELSAWSRAAKNEGAGVTFEKIVRDSGFLAAVLNHPSATEKMAKLRALFDLLKSFIERDKHYALERFFEYLDLMEEHGVTIKTSETARLAGRVRLMTAHRSKGQEFDYVFIMNAADRKWGSRFRRESIKLPQQIYRVLQKTGVELKEDESDDQDQNDNEPREDDERNVFYVALTRARKEVFITRSRTDRDGRELLPTKFIAELTSEILPALDVLKYEKDYGAHQAEIEFAPAVPKTPELKDKEFLNTLFATQGLSVTALNNYLECPWHYFYVNLIRVPEAPNKHLSFGNAVHAALKSCFDKITETGGQLENGKKYLVRRFEEELAGEPIQNSDYEEALAKGQKILPIFYDEYHATWLPRAGSEIRIVGISLDDGTLINGKLDRIEFLTDQSLRVIDYKTGRTKTRNDIEGNTTSSDGNYKRQLVFYKLLLDKEGKYEMAEGVIQFVEQDERGKSHREAFEIQRGAVKILEQQIKDVAKEIRDLSFWNQGCREPDCKYCDLRRGMK